MDDGAAIERMDILEGIDIVMRAAGAAMGHHDSSAMRHAPLDFIPADYTVVR